MAEMLLEEGQLGSIQEIDIDIDIDNYEERHIYNSICEYSRRMCEFFSNKIDKLSPSDVITRDRTILKRKIEPRSQPTIKVLQPAQTKLFRSDTEILTNTNTNTRIKKIDSNQFKSFFSTSEPPDLKTIKDVNRQIILELQSLSEKPSRILEIERIKRKGSDKSINQEEKIDEEEEDEEQVIQKQDIKKIYNPVNKPTYRSGIENNKVNYIMYDNRAIVVLPIPDDREKIQIIFNSNGTWVPNGGIGPGYPKCKTCPFYRSTGKSNEANFPDMWFPFFRVKTSIPGQSKSISKMPRGWIYKAWGLQSVSQLRKRLVERFPDKIQAVEGNESSDFLFCFFEKFSHWWQIQLSLKLPIKDGTLWETIPILKNLKGIVENYDYDHFGGDRNCFLPIKTAQLQTYKLKSEPIDIYQEFQTTLDTDQGKITTSNTPEVINEWLRGGTLNHDKSNALCVEDDEDH